ncbi:nucleoside-binding protein [Aestuariibacter sp. AA17]|uniref:Nucleoside-binding protein n=1 Tax=Fluctibacter corallii TaxID=2984329 RepID=A0ABT3A530_9ALTE|nr:outer membrane protein OmpK [Aestuariibacter sp. AA17]MCV2883723.1 nucleoside-binding protein [Aestuariibacter sp. AA17]
MIRLFTIPVCIGAMFSSFSLMAANWSTTEVHYQRGTLDVPIFAQNGVTDADTTVITLQHASGWDYGDNFFFVDYIDDDEEDGFNDTDFYAEVYLNFSLSKMTGNNVGFGPVRDIGLLMGGNFSGDAKVKKYLPGVRFSMDAPGFAFLNLDVTAYFDDSDGVTRGGAPTEDNSYMFDVNWDYPFTVGSQHFSITGHAEYIGSRDNEFGGKVSHWILAQPQFRWDIGHAIFDRKDTIYAGIEYQYWRNKLGDDSTDESAVQLLLVWRL